MKHQDSKYQAQSRRALITVFLINCFLISGCSLETKHDFDFISGTYHVEGLRVESIVPMPNTTNEEPRIDSTMISLDFEIQKPENRQDTLRIIGLISPQAGNYGVFAHWENDSLIIDLNHTGHKYTGTGILKNGMINLELVYHYRGIVITSYLEGSRIN